MTRGELKNLQLLDDKIQKAVDLVTRLKTENADLSGELAEWKAEARQGKGANDELKKFRVSHDRLSEDHERLTEDHEVLSRDHEELSRQMTAVQGERQAMLDRVDGLLARLDEVLD